MGTNRVLIIGESPKGQLSDCLNSLTLKRLSLNLEQVGIKISECSFTEICKCELGSRADLVVVGQKCMPRLRQQIVDIKPRLVITLGVVSNALFAQEYVIECDVGKLVALEDFNYLPLWHTSPANPQGVRRNAALLSQLHINP